MTSRETMRRRCRGFSLPELLVVSVILAIMMAFIVPLAGESLYKARIRANVNQFALDLRAARWTAVSRGAPVDVVVAADPVNSYQYTDIRGRLRQFEMPEGVRILGSTNPIRFLANGSVTGGSTTVIEAQIADSRISRWTVTTSTLGISRTTHEQVGS